MFVTLPTPACLNTSSPHPWRLLRRTAPANQKVPDPRSILPSRGWPARPLRLAQNSAALLRKEAFASREVRAIPAFSASASAYSAALAP